MTQPSAIFEEMRSAMRMFHRGDREEARQALEDIWDGLGEEGNAFYRCVAAHYIADMQDDLQEELAWDIRALEIADAHAGDPSIRAFLPSLHLNLADCYRLMGDFDKAGEHADKGMELSAVLGNDRYGHTVREGLFRVSSQIEQGDSGPAMVFDFD
jgi:tetratricopeptide (TPR) repeat protein